MKPLISVIIPTYQRRNDLKQAIDSVLFQTYKNFEVLIIDDGSTDGTKELVNSYKDKRILYLWQKNSGLPANPRNKGIEIAKGEWIAFLDSDDKWGPRKLEICSNYINDGMDLIYHDLQTFEENTRFFKKINFKSKNLKKPILNDLLMKLNPIKNSSVIVRKKILERVGGISEDKNLFAVEDYHTWLKIAKITQNFYYIPSTLGYYNIHSNNISNKNMSIPIKYAVSDFIPELNYKQKVQLEISLKFVSARYNFLNLQYKNAIRDLLFILKKGTFFLKVKSLFMLIIILTKYQL